MLNSGIDLCYQGTGGCRTSTHKEKSLIPFSYHVTVIAERLRWKMGRGRERGGETDLPCAFESDREHARGDIFAICSRNLIEFVSFPIFMQKASIRPVHVMKTYCLNSCGSYVN